MKTIKVHSYKSNSNELDIVHKEILSSIQNYSPKELSEFLSDGGYVLPSIFNKVRNANHFVETSVIFLKFNSSPDNLTEILESFALNTFVQENVSFILNSGNSSVYLALILDNPIYHFSQFKVVISYLQNIFPDLSDDSVYCSQMIHKGFSAIEVKFDNTFKWSSLIPNDLLPSGNPKIVRKEKNMSDSFSSYNPEFNQNEITSLLRNKQLDEYRDYLESNTLINLSNSSPIIMKKDIVSFFNSLNTKELFGLPKVESYFNCILTEDSLRSARVRKAKNLNIFYYSTTIKDTLISLTNFEVLANILDVGNVDELVEIILYVFNLDITIPDNLVPMKDNLEHLENLFLNKEGFKENYPSAYKVLYKHRDIIMSYLAIISEYPNLQTINGVKQYYYLSAKSVSSILENFSEINLYTQVKTMLKIINLLAYLNIIRKLSVEEYPIGIKIYLMNLKRSMKVAKVNSVIFLDISKNFNELMTHIEEKCNFLLNNGYTFQGFSQKFVNRIEGIETSEKIYVQTKYNTNSDNFNSFLNDLKKVLLTLITTDTKYVLDSIVKLKMHEKYTQTTTEIHYKHASNEVLKFEELNNITRVKASKKVKESLGIDSSISSYTYIFVKDLNLD